MARAKKRKRHQGCDLGKLIDAIERAISTATKIYQAVEPIAKRILTNRRKTK
jgi:hypothetical protein